jgi:2-methylcitrate dehydratase PrpD
VVPAVLAAAEAASTSGSDTLAAILAGYEIGVRVGEAMGGTPAGVHDIGTWGTIGAAAGVAHVVSGAQPEAVAAAIDLAAAVPGRFDAHTVFAGADGQHLLLGLAAQSAVVIGTSAAAGLRAPAGTLECYFLPSMGADPDAERLVDDLDGSAWGRYRILAGYVKRHPTCAHLHGVNDAVEDLLVGGRFDPATVEKVVVRTYTAAASFDEPDPSGDLAARFSIPYTVAVALVSGILDTSSFSPRWLADRAVRDLAARVEVRADPTLDSRYPSGRPAVVTVFKADGTAAEARADRPRGDGADAIDDPGVAAKPLGLLTEAVGAQQAGTFLDAVSSLEAGDAARFGSVLRQIFSPPRGL